MRALQSEIESFNSHSMERHKLNLESARNLLSLNERSFTDIIAAIQRMQTAIPSWALGTGGTRFGRFSLGGEPRNLEEKIQDVGLIAGLTRATNSISLHIPWDIPSDPQAIKELLKENALTIDAVNSNTFQDQPGQKYSYKFGSLCHHDKDTRQQAIDHNIEVIEYGKTLGSNCLSVWLADGTNFPGQSDFRTDYLYTRQSLETIYKHMPDTWTMLIEYKPYEPNFYSMVIPDWGTSYQLCQACGDKAHVLVDLGHHLPNTNIEQIVARLLYFERLGGFHFNGSMYGDDDLTTGAIKPYQLFLIFCELVAGARDTSLKNPPVAYMIDASHNTKDPLEDLMGSLENILTAYTKALLIDFEALRGFQEHSDVIGAERLLQSAFNADVRPLIAEARIRAGGCIDPLGFFRAKNIRKNLVSERGTKTVATGL